MSLATHSFEVIPAVDIKGGRCVRLFQGDYSQETVYSQDPVQVASTWESQGARRLHVVDLDGAASGRLLNLPVIEGILKAVSIPVQVGGGIRTLETVARLLDIGVQRVVLGTVAVEDPHIVSGAVERFPGSILVSIDGREGYVATRGWKMGTQVRTVDLVKHVLGMGVETFIYTDIGRDGTLTEPNFVAIREILDCATAGVIASGGIATMAHLARLKDLGCSGAIVGKALYRGLISLEEASRL